MTSERGVRHPVEESAAAARRYGQKYWRPHLLQRLGKARQGHGLRRCLLDERGNSLEGLAPAGREESLERRVGGLVRVDLDAFHHRNGGVADRLAEGAVVFASGGVEAASSVPLSHDAGEELVETPWVHTVPAQGHLAAHEPVFNLRRAKEALETAAESAAAEATLRTSWPPLAGPPPTRTVEGCTRAQYSRSEPSGSSLQMMHLGFSPRNSGPSPFFCDEQRC